MKYGISDALKAILVGVAAVVMTAMLLEIWALTE